MKKQRGKHYILSYLIILKNKRMGKDYMDFVYEIERDCEALSPDIISRLCKRAIKKMNKVNSYLAGSTDDYPSSFTFFDILSIELQSKCYEEINHYLRDFVDNTLDDEYDKLPPLERFVLDHSECAANLDCDIEAVQTKIYETFHEMLNKHWTTKKIQKFEERGY